jgi:hypothetical protein
MRIDLGDDEQPDDRRDRRHHVQRVRLLLLQAQFDARHLRHAHRQLVGRQVPVLDHPVEDAREAAAAAGHPLAQLVETPRAPQAFRLGRQIGRRHLLQAEVDEPLERHGQRQHGQRADRHDAQAAVRQFGGEVQALRSGRGCEQQQAVQAEAGQSGHRRPLCSISNECNTMATPIRIIFFYIRAEKITTTWNSAPQKSLPRGRR